MLFHKKLRPSKQSEPTAVLFETLLGDNLDSEGTITSDTDITISSKFRGQIKTSAKLTIDQNAEVDAEVEAQDLTVLGKLNGKAVVSGQSVLHNSAIANANIRTGTLKIETGAVLIGKISTAVVGK
ncbi:polymer-forming cytoskeletal protein [Candidatus Saccharibacteria bacterium]|nr:polymer-forming cytoskeletal protein [Candidatus Saccharibacteria bacterium]MCB9834448.1 polymer-forming cytoskeletal protein [Candidatus Nomurabacteria bacterium]